MKLGYVDQSRDALDPNKTVWEEISGGADVIYLGKKEVNSRAYCSSFNFKGGDQQQKVGSLSGGQRNRVHMAKMIKSGSNVLLLDEPTNDLDTETLAALEDALEDFAGCAVIISHDRMFLDRIHEQSRHIQAGLFHDFLEACWAGHIHLGQTIAYDVQTCQHNATAHQFRCQGFGDFHVAFAHVLCHAFAARCQIATGFAILWNACQGIRQRLAIDDQHALVTMHNFWNVALCHDGAGIVQHQGFQNRADIGIVGTQTEDAHTAHAIQRFDDNVLLFC